MGADAQPDHASADPPRISAIVTCKGRLAHLKQSLPGLIAAFDEVVVVDYDCPEASGDWVAAAFPNAVVVRQTDRPLFNLCIARNLGAAAARGAWLLFVDADVCVSAGLADQALALLRAGTYFLPEPRYDQLCGVVLVARADFDALGGYDEVFEGWGSEDLDLTGRLQQAGLRCGVLDARLFGMIHHEDALRTEYQAIKDFTRNAAINSLYRIIKRDLERLGLKQDFAARQRMYADIRAALARSGSTRRITVAVRNDHLIGQASAQSRLSYDLSGLTPLTTPESADD